MVKIVAHDALGAGLNMVADPLENAAALFAMPLNVTDYFNTPWDNGTTLFRYTISGHPTLVGASAVTTVGANSKEHHDITYEVPGGVAALTLKEIDMSVASGLDPSQCAVAYGYVDMSGDDHVIGNSFDDVILGLGGNDYLAGNGGNDTILGGDGDDKLLGGDGNDKLFGGAGADLLDGGNGTDVVSYTRETAAVVVSLLNPATNAGAAVGDKMSNVENIAGTGFDDILEGDDAANLLMGGAGDDMLLGGNGRDILKGSAGADVLNGGAGVDIASYTRSAQGVVVYLENTGQNTGDAAGDTFVDVEGLAGTAFDDVLIGNSGNNRLFGGDGDDILVGLQGADRLKGGSGVDVASYTGSARGVVANLADSDQNTGDAAGDTYVDIEGLSGTAFADILVGDAGDNRLYGGDGDDTILGGLGDDLIIGSLRDIIDGGDGTDTVDFSRMNVGVSMTALEDDFDPGECLVTNVEVFIGSDHDDDFYFAADEGQYWYGISTDTYVEAGAGDDVMYLSFGNDTVFGGAGSDIINLFNGDDIAYGGDGNDFISAWLGDKVIYGDAGDDSIMSSAHATPAATFNQFFGGDGNDHFRVERRLETVTEMYGEAGNDSFDLHAGTVTVSGGSGIDAFYFWSVSNVIGDIAATSATITDWHNEVLTFWKYDLYPTEADVLAAANVINGSVVLTLDREYGDTTEIVLEGVSDIAALTGYIELGP